MVGIINIERVIDAIVNIVRIPFIMKKKRPQLSMMSAKGMR